MIFWRGLPFKNTAPTVKHRTLRSVVHICLNHGPPPFSPLFFPLVAGAVKKIAIQMFRSTKRVVNIEFILRRIHFVNRFFEKSAAASSLRLSGSSSIGRKRCIGSWSSILAHTSPRGWAALPPPWAEVTAGGRGRRGEPDVRDVEDRPTHHLARPPRRPQAPWGDWRGFRGSLR